MNKGLEAFNELKEGHWFDFANTYFSLNPKLKMDLIIIEKALKDYEKQDNIINIIKEIIEFNIQEPKIEVKENGEISLLSKIGMSLRKELNEKERELFREWILKECFPKELKTLEIVKEKRVEIRVIFHTTNVMEYNEKTRQYYDCLPLTQEEYNLLKETLE